MNERNALGKVFHLTLDYNNFLPGHGHASTYARETWIDTALNDLSAEELMGRNESFDSLTYVVKASHKLKKDHLEDIEPYLGYQPLEVIRHTLENTTQLANSILQSPMKRHFQSRFPFLNRTRLQETVSTDTFYANCMGVTGKTCAQVFYGVSSHVINIYGMKSKAQFPEVYKDFMREEGIPSILH